MNIISFPKNEWDSIKSRLNNGKIVYTIRVSNEYEKFKEGDILKTEWGLEVRIMSVKKITGGINELKIKYKFFDELTEEIIQELSGYDKMEIISLGAILRS
ncbi:MAG: hypothetical protein WC445_01890 [Patescibacteria group bacterium]